MVAADTSYFSRYLASLWEGRKAERQEDRRSQPRSEFRMLGFLHTWWQYWSILRKITPLQLSLLVFKNTQKSGSYLICHLNQNLISEAAIGKSSLDDVVPEQVLLSTVQVWVTHEPKNLLRAWAVTHRTHTSTTQSPKFIGLAKRNGLNRHI